MFFAVVLSGFPLPSYHNTLALDHSSLCVVGTATLRKLSGEGGRSQINDIKKLMSLLIYFRVGGGAVRGGGWGRGRGCPRQQ